MQDPTEPPSPSQEWARQLKGLALLALVMIGVQLLNQLTHYSLNYLGIIPRHLSRLPTILIAPFLHANWTHLFANLPPLLMLLLLMGSYGSRSMVVASVAITLLTGSLVWLLAPANIHIGASGVVLGCWSYLMARAWFAPDTRSLVLALLVVVFYGGLVWSLLDFRPHVSWASHLFGALAGVIVARVMSRGKDQESR